MPTTKTTSKKTTSSKQSDAAERTARLNRIYGILEEMLQVFSSDDAEHFTSTDLAILGDYLEGVEGNMFGKLHMRLAVAPLPRRAAAKKAPHKKTPPKKKGRTRG